MKPIQLLSLFIISFCCVSLHGVAEAQSANQNVLERLLKKDVASKQEKFDSIQNSFSEIIEYLHVVHKQITDALERNDLQNLEHHIALFEAAMNSLHSVRADIANANLEDQYRNLCSTLDEELARFEETGKLLEDKGYRLSCCQLSCGKEKEGQRGQQVLEGQKEIPEQRVQQDHAAQGQLV